MSKIFTVLCHPEVGSGCGRRSCPGELLLCLQGFQEKRFALAGPDPELRPSPSDSPSARRKMTIKANIFCKIRKTSFPAEFTTESALGKVGRNPGKCH